MIFSNTVYTIDVQIAYKYDLVEWDVFKLTEKSNTTNIYKLNVNTTGQSIL